MTIPSDHPARVCIRYQHWSIHQSGCRAHVWIDALHSAPGHQIDRNRRATRASADEPGRACSD